MDLHFERQPRKPWFRIFFGRKKGLKHADDFPRIEAEWVDARPKKVEAYQKICGFPVNEVLPITYPQVMATPLHMQMLANREFPLPIMGLVHVGQKIEQLRPISSKETLRFHCWVDGFRQVRRGGQFDLHTEAFSGDEKCWKAVATTFVRGFEGHGRKEGKTPVPSFPEEADATEEALDIRENLGRKYMAISGDFNFIHIHAWLAKPFGFKRAIIHGMWSLARCAASFPKEIATIEAAFVRPIFLPSKPRLKRCEGRDGVCIAQLLQADTDKLHLWVRGSASRESLG